MAWGLYWLSKIQAEPETPDGPLRWIASGKTILNNKGNPVKQYEPYFSQNERGEPDHRFEEPQEVGVTPILYYDAVRRQVRTEMPDGTYSRVTFSPWFMAAYDGNDTVLEPNNSWHIRYSSGTPEEQRAARLAEVHANTPAVMHLDSLGREVVVIAHNKPAQVEVRNEPQHVAVMLVKLGFLRHPNLQLECGTRAVSVDSFGKPDVFLQSQPGAGTEN